MFKEPMEPRQAKLIASMEETLGVPFMGSTHMEACVYIDDHIDMYHKIAQGNLVVLDMPKIEGCD